MFKIINIFVSYFQVLFDQCGAGWQQRQLASDVCVGNSAELAWASAIYLPLVCVSSEPQFTDFQTGVNDRACPHQKLSLSQRPDCLSHIIAQFLDISPCHFLIQADCTSCCQDDIIDSCSHIWFLPSALIISFGARVILCFVC